jgi:hypothetical protein
VRLGVAGLLAGSCRFPFSTLWPAILLLENFNLSVRSSLLSFVLTSLSYSCGLAPLAAVACPSTLLPLSYSFLTLPCSIPCREVTFTSPRVATPRGTAKSPHQSSWAQKLSLKHEGLSTTEKVERERRLKDPLRGAACSSPSSQWICSFVPSKGKKRNKLYELFCMCIHVDGWVSS